MGICLARSRVNLLGNKPNKSMLICLLLPLRPSYYSSNKQTSKKKSDNLIKYIILRCIFFKTDQDTTCVSCVKTSGGSRRVVQNQHKQRNLVKV